VRRDGDRFLDDAIDMAEGRATLEFRPHRLDGYVVALCDDLDGSVGAVARGPDHSALLGGTQREVSIANALNATGDDESTSCHWFRQTRKGPNQANQP